MKFDSPKCANCRAPIKRQDINMQLDIATCTSCNTVYKFSRLLYQNQSNQHKSNRQLVEGIVYEDYRLVPKITIALKKLSNYKFNGISSIITLVFGTAMFLIPELIAKCFGLLILFLAAYLFKQFLYRYTTNYKIELGLDRMIVSRNNVEQHRINPDDIEQVYIERRDGGSSGQTKYFEHDIYIKLKNKEAFKIVQHILPIEVANEIEYIIEQRYLIQDVILKEEYHPDLNNVHPEVPKIVHDLVNKIHQNKKS